MNFGRFVFPVFPWIFREGWPRSFAPGDSSEFEKKKKLTCDFDAQSGSYRVTWYVDARKLDTWRSKNKSRIFKNIAPLLHP
jgi:hypothetical protein